MEKYSNLSNLSSVMETETISKNRTSPQCRVSRENIFRKALFSILAASVIIFSGCDSGNVAYIKDSTWSEDETVEIGSALDGYDYFIKTEWEEYETKQGREIVEFKGYYFKSDLVVRIQFTLFKDFWAMDDDGNDFKINYQGISYVTNSGEEREEKNLDLMKKIYKNKELFSEYEMQFYDMSPQKSKWKKDEKTGKKSKKESKKESKTVKSQKGARDLITPTSIDGCEVIGKTIKEVQPHFNFGDIVDWEKMDENFIRVSAFENALLGFYLDGKGKIVSVFIYTDAYSTADGFKVGSTSGDVLKKYPQNMLEYDDEIGWNYTKINDVILFFEQGGDDSIECIAIQGNVKE